MAGKLAICAFGLGVVAVVGCASGGKSGQAAAPEAVVHSVAIGDNCQAPAETLIAEGDKVEFTAPANYRVVLDEKTAATGAYFEGMLSGSCSPTAAHPHKFDVPKNGKTKTCKIQKGSGAHDRTWSYAVTLFDDGGQQHCHVDPNICVVTCN